ncbi:Protein DEHYDRATION-INDUCED 6 [Ananas comosus]|uniref:Protein DEHYDRATION-INDUCED 6 n=1 Tax=Ananas comosus TaxID=4615 RepID=A0A199W3E4_ANACO|nr:Protein DEHYDRATION-INDUCED 6 [Ananas comosus]
MEAAKRLQSRYDSYLGFEEIESGDDGENRAEFPCLFCGEVFDFVGLCCHIDGEHPIESKNGSHNSCSLGLSCLCSQGRDGLGWPHDDATQKLLQDILSPF